MFSEIKLINVKTLSVGTGIAWTGDLLSTETGCVVATVRDDGRGGRLWINPSEGHWELMRKLEKEAGSIFPEDYEPLESIIASTKDDCDLSSGVETVKGWGVK